MAAKGAFGVLLMIVGLAIFAFWSYPLWTEIASINAERDSVNGTLERIKALAKKKDQISKDYNSISQNDLANLEEFFPRTQESGLMLLNTNKLAKENGMLLKSIAMTEGTEEPPTKDSNPKIKNFSFNASLSGSYASFNSFLKSLEKTRRLIEIDKLSFDAGSALQSKKDFYEYTISAHTYWRK
ncbi:type 4a pilus biogenesis protein PilO [Candidatus Giovannonibacteria bacterium]|nr:type 4a pilus biogenesis protein PilO [Candidatus Giovannonibacteria bacterium]